MKQADSYLFENPGGSAQEKPHLNPAGPPEHPARSVSSRRPGTRRWFKHLSLRTRFSESTSDTDEPSTASPDTVD